MLTKEMDDDSTLTIDSTVPEKSGSGLEKKSVQLKEKNGSDTATRCYASIILLNAPEKMTLGLDHCAWCIEYKFMGIRLIPPGPHFLWWKPLNEDEMNVLGLFIYLKENQVLVRRWDSTTESFEMIDEDEANHYQCAVVRGELNANLGLYLQEYRARWKELSRFITEETIHRIEPLKKFVMSAAEEYDEEQQLTHTDKQNLHATSHLETTDEAIHVTSNTLFFCDILKSSIPASACPSEITRHSLDRSTVLNQLVKKDFNNSWKELLGEIQFAFIAFSLGQNYEAFQHWRDLIILLCTCEDALKHLPELYENFLRVLHGHLSQLPDDFFEGLTQGNFLVSSLTNLVEICKDETTTQRIRRRIKIIEDLIDKKFHSNLKDLFSGTEDAPIVVQNDVQFISWDTKETIETDT